MCVILFKPKEHHLSDELIKECWERNSDGCGFMYSKQRQLKVFKSADKLEPVLKKYREVVDEQKKNVIWHFRRATVGKVSDENTQPFIVNRYGWAHNGTIYKLKKKLLKDESDSLALGRMFLSENTIDPFAKFSEVLIEDFLDDDRLTIMNNNGSVVIFNQKEGEWDNNIWFSDPSWKKKGMGKIAYYGYGYDLPDTYGNQTRRNPNISEIHSDSIIKRDVKVGNLANAKDGYNIWSDGRVWDDDCDVPRYVNWQDHSDLILRGYCKKLFARPKREKIKSKKPNNYCHKYYASYLARSPELIPKKRVTLLARSLNEPSSLSTGSCYICSGAQIDDLTSITCNYCRSLSLENTLRRDGYI